MFCVRKQGKWENMYIHSSFIKRNTEPINQKTVKLVICQSIDLHFGFKWYKGSNFETILENIHLEQKSKNAGISGSQAVTTAKERIRHVNANSYF